jgi:hypothetical protein
MGIARILYRVPSKYDRTLPYTYAACITLIPGANGLTDTSYADTICGLIEYLDDYGIEPADVELYGIFRGRQLPLDKSLCTDEDGMWLQRPEICHKLEEHYRRTMEEQYRGHKEYTPCSYEDRSRKATGPF